MTDPNSDDPDRIDQEIRINELKHQAEDLAGGQMYAYEADNAPPDIVEGFWANVVEYESAPDTSDFEQLTRAGIDLPAPEEMEDAALNAKLWEVIYALADRNTFLSNTDHLSDRELYACLWEDLLHELKKDIAASDWHCHLDILGSGSEEDTKLYLRYYADEKWRADWAKNWPNDPIPPREQPPYDRDRHLPKAPH